jgi:hypothetical protein
MTPRAWSLSAHPLPLQQETLESLAAFTMLEPNVCEDDESSEQGFGSSQTAANGVAPQPATTSAVTDADDSDSRRSFSWRAARGLMRGVSYSCVGFVRLMWRLFAEFIRSSVRRGKMQP